MGLLSDRVLNPSSGHLKTLTYHNHLNIYGKWSCHHLHGVFNHHLRRTASSSSRSRNNAQQLNLWWSPTPLHWRQILHGALPYTNSQLLVSKRNWSSW